MPGFHILIGADKLFKPFRTLCYIE